MLRNKVLIGILIGLLVVILAVYFTPVYLCQRMYYPGTVINGVECGFKTPEYVEGILHEKPSDYNIEVKFRDGTETINGEDVSLKLDYLTGLQDIKNKQNPFKWLDTFKNNQYKVEKIITFDEEKVEKKASKFKELQPENMRDPKNPSIELKDDEVVAIAGDQGNKILNSKNVYRYICEAIRTLEESVDIDEKECYAVSVYNPESPKVIECLAYCNRITGLTVEYDYGGTYIPFTKDQLFSMLKIDENYNVVVSKNNVGRVMQAYSRMHDTYGTIRKFNAHDRSTIYLDSESYGWELDVETETDTLFNELIHKQPVKRAPEFLHTAYTYVDKEDDIGDLYCEVDLANQHMYVYKNHRVVLDSDVVTGCVGLGRGTPGGLYSISFKQSPAVLKGEDYESKVTYWMPFNGGIGFHDATWRGWFGGDIYYWSGSHGCVNMPYDAAEELYGIIEEGVPVIVY